MSDQQVASEETNPLHQSIDPKRLRFVSVPIPTENLKEFFTDKSLIFVTDYSTSRLKGDPFLTYLTNLNIPCDVRFSEGLDYETYSQIMLAYMNQISVMTAPSLYIMAAELLLCAKGMPHAGSPYRTSASAEVIQRFIEENKDLLDRWLHFIDSTQVYALSSIKVLNQHYKPKERFPVIDDRDYVGRNVVMLFKAPLFIAFYFASAGLAFKDSFKHSYFERQFEDYMFKNNRMAEYFNHENNMAALLFPAFASGGFTLDDVKVGLFSIGVFHKESPYYEAQPYVAAPEHQISDTLQV